ncbi:Hint domain-containing protein [Paracoccus sp. S1E-3]|nr:Hint domain-containing protein [Paracoccus sp. S1E-3]
MVHPDVSFDPEIVDLQIVCFAAGTGIETANGEVLVEELAIGDEVATLDHGLCPIRWIGSQALGAADLEATPGLRPVRIKAGALGPDRPRRDLVVSPQHRILVRSTVAERMFGSDEVLVAAKHLLTHEGIEIADDLEEVIYWHFLLDDHQIVRSNGVKTETLFTGPQALKSVSAESRDEIFAIFPELATADDADYAPARPLVPGRPARNLARRLTQNGKPIFEATGAH